MSKITYKEYSSMNITIYSSSTSELIKEVPVPEQLTAQARMLLDTKVYTVQSEQASEDFYDYIVETLAINESFYYDLK